MRTIRIGNYSGNFGNNLVTKGGCKGTTCNRIAAKGVYKGGSDRTRKCPKGKKFCKWGKSKTMRKKEDFTTKKKSNVYNESRLKKLIGRRTMRAPIFSFVGGVGKKGYSHPGKRQASRTMKGKLDFTTKKHNKFFNRGNHRQDHAQGSRRVRNPYMNLRKGKKSRKKAKKMKRFVSAVPAVNPMVAGPQRGGLQHTDYSKRMNYSFNKPKWDDMLRATFRETKAAHDARVVDRGQSGGSSLQYSDLKGLTSTQALAKGASNYYEVVNDPGQNGVLATPVPIKAKASCPTPTPGVLPLKA